MNRLRDIEHRKTFRIKVSNSRRRGYHPRVFYTHYPDDILESVADEGKWKIIISRRSVLVGTQQVMLPSFLPDHVQKAPQYLSRCRKFSISRNPLHGTLMISRHDLIVVNFITSPTPCMEPEPKNRCGLDNKKCMKTEHSRKQIQKNVLKEGFTSWVISEPPYWVRKSASNMNIRMILGYLTKKTWHIKINNVGHELRILSQQAISGLHLSTQTS